jgi:EAL domain-containing protein (putative c-di-GMP-specific phosphodiesterase class I)
MEDQIRLRTEELTKGDRWDNRALPADRDIRLSGHRGDSLEQELREALRCRALYAQFQPQYDLVSGRGCGVEALARWVLWTGEVIAPSVFIPLAERAGMIHTLGAWMLKSACVAASEWCSRDARVTTLSVNVSALQIDHEFQGVIARTLEESGFPAEQLELEITESALIENPALTIEYLNVWKQLGIRIAMDDFGTGYSSLGNLSRLPVDRLKLDRSLVHRMTLDRKSAAVVRLIVAMGVELGIEVIAEGVETEEQLQKLMEFGCTQVQGFLLGRPLAANRVQAALSMAWGSRPVLHSRPVSTAAMISYAH